MNTTTREQIKEYLLENNLVVHSGWNGDNYYEIAEDYRIDYIVEEIEEEMSEKGQTVEQVVGESVYDIGK